MLLGYSPQFRLRFGRDFGLRPMLHLLLLETLVKSVEIWLMLLFSQSSLLLNRVSVGVRAEWGHAYRLLSPLE